jgi:hypothetical protein
MQVTRLTTSDNPFNPVTQFDQWYTWDATHGYHTLAYQARVTRTSSELSQADQEQAEMQAMDDIVAQHDGWYKKVTGVIEDQPT